MKSLPVDVLKIDKTLLKGCPTTAAWWRRLSTGAKPQSA
jgi:EAL domain-containing protein (putative c-di-GMP-specific phosphodiesterase class I)